jgi:hypothetical protein
MPWPRLEAPRHAWDVQAIGDERHRLNSIPPTISATIIAQQRATTILVRRSWRA